MTLMKLIGVDGQVDGVAVRAVRQGSAAVEAGLLLGDRLLAVNGVPIATSAQVRRHLEPAGA